MCENGKAVDEVETEAQKEVVEGARVDGGSPAYPLRLTRLMRLMMQRRANDQIGTGVLE